MNGESGELIEYNDATRVERGVSETDGQNRARHTLLI